MSAEVSMLPMLPLLRSLCIVLMLALLLSLGRDRLLLLESRWRVKGKALMLLLLLLLFMPPSAYYVNKMTIRMKTMIKVGDDTAPSPLSLLILSLLPRT